MRRRGRRRRPGRRRRLACAFRDRSLSFHPESPLLLYPVRTVRRRNVLEAGLLVSLPGLKRTEIVYSRLVEQCFHEGLIPGLWGIGEDLAEAGLSFRDTVQASDLVVSTAVRDGCGAATAAGCTSSPGGCPGRRCGGCGRSPAGREAPAAAADGEAVLRRFARPENLRMLLE